MPKIPRSPERTQPRTIDASYSLAAMPEIHDETLTGYIDQQHRETEPRLNKLTKGIAATAVGAVMYGATLLGVDVARGIEEGKAAVRDSHSQVHDIYTDTAEVEPLYRNHATFVLTGLGTKNPSATAESLTVHRNVGRVFAIEYSNKDLNTTDMAERILETASAYNISEISFDGYSAGGPIALDIAAHVHRLDPELQIISVTLNSSPLGKNDGKDSLTQRSRDGIDVMETIMGINEDVAYYKNGHIAVEVFNRNGSYVERSSGANLPDAFVVHGWNTFSYNGVAYTLDYPEALEQLHAVIRKLDNPDAASALLIWEQAKFIVRSDYKDNIKALPDDVHYTYTRAEAAGADSVVDVESGEENFVSVMEELDEDYTVVREDVGHANPNEKEESYRRMIGREIHPEITRALMLHEVRDELDRITAESVAKRNKALEQTEPLATEPN